MNVCDCGAEAKARGLCYGCYAKARRNGTLKDHPYKRPPDAPHSNRAGLFGDPRLPSRFWRQVERSLGCWRWTGPLSNHDGYGHISIGARREACHRHVYRALVGQIPDESEVDHQCRVRACVNPAHLQLVDKKRNGENRAGANSNSKSGIRGVSWDTARGKWFVQAHGRGKTYPGGRFDSIEEAEAAAIALRATLFTNSLADSA